MMLWSIIYAIISDLGLGFSLVQSVVNGCAK